MVTHFWYISSPFPAARRACACFWVSAVCMLLGFILNWFWMSCISGSCCLVVSVIGLNSPMVLVWVWRMSISPRVIRDFPALGVIAFM